MDLGPSTAGGTGAGEQRRAQRFPWMPFAAVMGVIVLVACLALGGAFAWRAVNSGSHAPGSTTKVIINPGQQQQGRQNDNSGNAPKTGSGATRSGQGAQTFSEPETVGLVTITPAALNDDAGTARSVASVLDTYFSGINQGDYGRSLSVMSDQLAGSAQDRAQFVQGVSSSTDSNVVLQGLTIPDPGVARAAVTFTSTQNAQQGDQGNTCQNWSLTYTFRQQGGSYVIDKSEPNEGQGYTPC